MNERDRQIDELFDRALDLPPAEQRRFVEEASGDDTELAETVLRLLAAASDAQDFLGESATKLRDQAISDVLAGAKADDIEDTASDRTGSRIGPYRIVGRLGRGGRSTVWKAERTDEDWQQQVAIKILRRGIDTDDVVARFVAERQILLLLEHPGIATILDGGTTEDGLPYFVMQLIEGDRITDYVRDRQLPFNDRLRLLIAVAESVAFAHRHLVIHRDIKPSNILVTADGRPILLDFGIAKVIDPTRDEIVGARTMTEMRVLTPDYASPEQLAGEAITTASDVYQLGLLMVELLDDPLRGDAGIVAHKAMRPEPGERYQSVQEFIDDLQALLDDRPIRARAPSARYRLAKFMKRQPWAAPAAVLVVLAAAGALVMNANYTRQVEAERDRAENIKSFVVDFLRAPDPFEGEGREVTVQEALANARERAVTAFADQPELRAEIFETLADVYTNLDLHATARELHEQRVKLLRNERADAADLLAARIDVAGSLVAEGDTEAARERLDALLEELDADFPGEHALQGFAHLYAGRAEKDYGDVATGAQHLETAVGLFRRGGDTQRADVARALHDLASAYNMMDRADDALAAIDEAIALRRELFGDDALPTLLSRVERATTLDKLHDYEAAALEYEALV
ncbi:MAG: serine/threonine-protein kinase, partial [Woeseiaceae bacterium]|nr:serine/threonine-protein kinase [Woeseiaceae bacterium]